MHSTAAADAFLARRDFLLKHRTDYDTAVRGFEWPVQEHFNWALDYFDAIAAGNDRPALHIVEEDGTETIRSFAELSAASNRVANFLRDLGARRGDCLMLMLGNEVALWETLLAAIKLGVVVTPATTLLTTADLQDRVDRGRVRHVVTSAANVSKFAGVTGTFTRIAVGDATVRMASLRFGEPRRRSLHRERRTRASDPMLLYFTSGTTAHAKARGAHASELSRRPPLDAVLDRLAGRRSSLEHQLARVGQARLELLLRPVERGGNRLHLQLRALQREGRARGTRPAPGDDAVRAADRLADADPAAAGRVSRGAA